ELHVAKPEVQAVLFGVNDNYLKLIEEGLNVTIRPFGDVIKIEGDQDAASQATEIIKKLTALVEQGVGISESDVLSALKMAQNGTLTYFQDLYKETLIKDNNGRPVRVKNFGQRNYVQAIKNNDLVFGI